MARGFESKAVESQIADRLADIEAKQIRSDEKVVAARDKKRSGLEMSRKRVAHDLKTAETDVHRTALKNALKFLDEELGKF
jgi:hypothetical protein